MREKGGQLTFPETTDADGDVVVRPEFLCVCLAPAIDATVRIDAWPTDGCVLKNAADTFLPGGKGLNVARWLATRGAHVACAGFLGQDNAAVFEKELARYGIEDRLKRVCGATRVNEMFVSPRGSFKVNRAADFGSYESFGGADGLARQVGVDPSQDLSGTVVVLSGSLPAGWPADACRRLVEAAKSAGATVVLDTSGAALGEGVKARPDVIKPNAEECEPLVGFVPKTPEEFRRATAELRSCCACPIVSDGGAGCWFDGAFFPAPKVKALDTTAAGDTLLAEWLWRRFCLSERADAAAPWACAAGGAACTMPGGEPPPVSLVESLRNRLVED